MTTYRLKDKPLDRPTWAAIRGRADQKEKNEMDLISQEFAFKVFIGRVVANWCARCGRWRIHYVSAGKEPAKVEDFQEEQTFPCTKCQARLPVIMDDAHTVLRNA